MSEKTRKVNYTRPASQIVRYQVKRKVEIKKYGERTGGTRAQLKAAVRLTQLRGTSGAVGIVADAVEQSDDS